MRRQFSSLLGALAIMTLAGVTGCSKKAPAGAVEAASPSAAKQGVSIDAPPEAPPPPVISSSEPAAPPPDVSQPPGQTLTPEQVEQQFKTAALQERAYEERLRRNGKWLEALKNANGNEQQRILAEIRAAKLSPAEIQELEAIKQYFGVTVSFR